MVSSVPEGANATPAINELAPRKKEKGGKRRVALINLSSTTGGSGLLTAATTNNCTNNKNEGGINILQVKSKKKRIVPNLISP